MKQKIFTNVFLVKTDVNSKPDKVCLAMKLRGFGVGMWNGSGGKPNEGESVEEAAIREVQEEMGVKVGALQKRAEIDFILRQEDKVVKMHTYLVTNWTGEPIETEEMRPRWFNIDEVPYEQMWKGDREWLPLILSGKRIRAKYTYSHEGGEVETREILEVADFDLNAVETTKSR